jgi:hypothetical protein
MPDATSNNSSVPSFFGSLSQFEFLDLTTAIGTLFPNSAHEVTTTQCNLSDILDLPEAEKNRLISDLALLVSHRGVVFFKNQIGLSVEKQKELGVRLGELSWGLHGAYRGASGSVGEKTSGLHVHPISEDVPELGKQVSLISSEK